MLNRLFSVFVAILIFFSCNEQPTQKSDNFYGPYLGQTNSSKIPKLFTEYFINTNLYERDATFSKDGKEFFYSIFLPSGKGVIITTKEIDGKWITPEVASFSGNYSDIEPFISEDGKKLYFVSNRPLTGGEPKDYDIWFVEKEGDIWEPPYNLSESINSKENEFYPTLSKNGNLYFTAHREDSYGGEDIYCSKLKDGKYSAPENLGTGVNSELGEFNSFVAYDESYIIFGSYGREGEIGGGDIYISFRGEDGTWGQAKLFNEPINSPYLDYCPYVTYDGKYLFFTSERISDEFQKADKMTYENIKYFINSAQNGSGDIYFVDAKVIKEMKDK
ncbi:MAG: PD40 domain-containing protein [Ignavibacteriales bacterium]|nr:PD40 domain-containing protein [Ignavibacteriales bacterium]